MACSHDLMAQFLSAASEVTGQAYLCTRGRLFGRVQSGREIGLVSQPAQMDGKPSSGRTMTGFTADTIRKLEQWPAFVARDVVRMAVEADVGTYGVCETEIAGDPNRSILKQHGIGSVMAVNSMRVSLL